MAKEIKDVESPGIEKKNPKKHVAQNGFRHFKETDMSLGEKSSSERPFVVKDETLLEMVLSSAS